MRRGWLNRTMMLALASVLFVSGCDHSVIEPEMGAPEQTEQTEQAQQAEVVVASGDYTVIEAPVMANGLLGGLLRLVGSVLHLVVDIIGLDGGILRLDKHELVVPAGAVLQPTLFQMEKVRSRQIVVDLTATRNGRDVGERGFEKPVTLTLSYDGLRVSDPSKLFILRVMPDGRHERLPSVVDRENKTVSAELDHFSKYAMACN
jgi:hypothetical protein